ncbi:MAG: ATP-binding protein [Pseudomonadota bacterium]
MKRLTHRWLLIGLAAASVVALTWAAHTHTRTKGHAALVEESYRRINVYSAALDDAVDRFAHLAPVLAENPDVIAAIARPDEVSAQAKAKNYLRRMNEAAGSLSMFLLDRAGRVIATSDEGMPAAKVAVSRAPYLTSALKHGAGRHYGTGGLDETPGYLMARVIEHNTAWIGAAVVKVDLRPTEWTWIAQEDVVALSTRSGEIVLSSHERLKSWRFDNALRTTGAPVERVQTASTLRFEQVGKLHQRLPVVRLRASPDKPVQGEGAGRFARLTEGDYLHLSVSQRHGWTLHHLAALAPAEALALQAAAFAGVLATMLWLAVFFLHQRIALQRTRALALRELEGRVADRTRQLQQMNAQLAREIEVRRATEDELREMQSRLVHAGRMAALGQLSAAVSHEVNQPITALRTNLASARLMVTRDTRESVTGVIDRMIGLVERVTEITGQLKLFSRRNRGRRVDVDVETALRNVEMLMGPAFRQNAVTLVLPHVEPDVFVHGSRVRFEQVLVNLLINALEAMTAQPAARPKVVSVEVEANEMDVVIRVRDDGPGIDADALSQIFEPFFSTKTESQDPLVGSEGGLGLGLAISRDIIVDMGGTLDARNAEQGGAVFTLRVPRRVAQVTMAQAAE